jgi:hypothetical protein
MRFRRTPATIYLRYPFLLGIQALAGVLIGGIGMWTGAWNKDEPYLILSGIVIIPLALSLLALKLLDGSIYERTNQSL